MKIIIILFLLLPTFVKGNDIKSEFENYMDKCYSENIFSGNIVMMKDFKPIFEKSYGYSNLNSQTLNSRFTKFNIASIGKMFTLILILQLIEDGKLNADDKISKYLDIFNNEKFKDVTVKHLITHTSGFGDFINPEFIRNKNNYKSLNDILKLISESDLSFESGKNKKYSNSGYCILGGIVEKISGKSFGENLSEKIFNVIEMNNSEYGIPTDYDTNKSIGYIPGIKGDLRSTENMLIGPTPAGGVYTTIDDMMKFNYSLFNDNNILKDESKFLLFTEFGTGKHKTFKDLINDPEFGSLIAGGAPGFNSLYIVLPSKGYSGFIFSNFDNGAERIEKGVMKIINGQIPEIPKPLLGNYLYKKLNEIGSDKFMESLNSLIAEGDYKIENDRTLNFTGYQFMNNGLIKESISIFKLNLEKFPDIINCYDSLAEAYLKSGNPVEAEKYYQLALKIDPENEMIKNNLEKLSRTN